MRAEFKKIFEHLWQWECAIVGSALRDYAEAKDIDILFPASQNFRKLSGELGVPYLGGWDENGVRIHQLKYRISGVGKPLNLIQRSDIEDIYNDWPHATLMQDGDYVRGEHHYIKPRSTNGEE
jgi:hypothetical protein